MLHRIRSLLLAPALVLLPAATALAGFPGGFPNSSTPACISLVGSDGVQASGRGTFTVTVRDLANNPVPGVTVTVDFSNAPDVRLCAQQLGSGLVLDCPNSRASLVSNPVGQATFTLLGGSTGAGNAVTLSNAGRIYADGYLLGSPSLSAYDLDGASGVGANDLSVWLGDFGTGNQYGRSDYDCSGGLGANDLSFWLSAYGSGTQAVSCAASCP